MTGRRLALEFFEDLGAKPFLICLGIGPTFGENDIPLMPLHELPVWVYGAPNFVEERDRALVAAFHGGAESLVRSLLGFLPMLSDCLTLGVEFPRLPQCNLNW